MQIPGWKALGLWALLGAFYGFVYLAMMSIGIFILPIAIVATIIAARKLRLWPEILGMVIAPAAVMLRLASMNWGFPRCAPGESSHMSLSSSGSGSVTDGTYSEVTRFEGCVGLNAPLLLWISIALIAAALTIYIAARYRELRSTRR